ncbi:class I SAM-dependent methyltransferase [Hoeflea sp.]|uniref:class I SAM-dependent methyltransferase n=1 Tax=Hoeflea sp. TaxID=1940281 RepID=UPI003B022CA1
MTASFTMNSHLGKRILALVRQGNYAHAGEEEAIDMALAGLAKDPHRSLLDAGCGRGGTAHYIQEHGWGKVTGVDIEPESVREAKHAYPGIRFEAGDIMDLGQRYAGYFDAVTMFNVLYAIPRHQHALSALAEAARPGAALMIFDYEDPGSYGAHAIMEGSAAFLPNPMAAGAIGGDLEAAGWSQTGHRDITEAYIRWYRHLVDRIVERRAEIEEIAQAEGYQRVLGLYSQLLDVLSAGHLQGAILSAERRA